MTDQYAVVGNPVKHSKSPQIHALFAQQTRQDVEYTTLLAPLDSFRKTVLTFFQHEQGRGLNVTVPFKQEAWELCDQLSDYAKQAGAVNTLVARDDGTIYGTNTDGVGLVTDLQTNHHLPLAGKNILILGAGGAVRGVLQPLLEKQPAKLFIANRTAAKADQLAELFSSLGGFSGNLAGGGFDAIPDTNFDIVINGTAASLTGDLPPVSESCIKKAQCCYDMMYSNDPTAFVQWATELGVPMSLDGLGMLIEQAAESFYIWRGVRPETQSAFSLLRDNTIT